LNKINGIVGQIQWIRLQKLAVLLAETGRVTTRKQQKRTIRQVPLSGRNTLAL
jgi:hypothetical protein